MNATDVDTIKTLMTPRLATATLVTLAPTNSSNIKYGNANAIVFAICNARNAHMYSDGITSKVNNVTLTLVITEMYSLFMISLLTL